MKRSVLAIGIMLIVGLASAYAQTTLVVGIDEDYMPWEKSVGGVPSGINIDIVNAMAKKLGMTVKFEVYPFKRLLANLESGVIDMAGGLEYNEERAAYAVYLSPAYQPTSKIFIMKKDSKKTLETYDDLYKLSVGVRTGNKQYEPFDSDAI